MKRTEQKNKEVIRVAFRILVWIVALSAVVLFVMRRVR